ncbi:MAG: ABC transporter ATP-binding protein [Desulfobacterales bacterium]|nr:ABC transporter ATP-binding protein [Desulfobacterales bacterium]MDJ0915384.1 ABC transporter ATP-binding protein [Desulfobacterales bacterium]
MSRPRNSDMILNVSDLKTWFPIKRGIVSRTIGYVKAVDGVSFRMFRGETVGLVGESGSGKTTLGRTLLGLEKARQGSIIFKGQNLLTMHRRVFRELRQKIQIIFQDPLSSLNPRLNVLDTVTEGLEEFGMVQGDRQAHAVKLLAEVGLDKDAIYRYPHEFSGGQRQRINIARAISLRPDFIVCDEPVSALDVSVQAQVINLLMDLRDKLNLSYLFISHDISVVSHIAQRILVMYRGKIVEQGSAKDVIHNPQHPYTQTLIAAVPVPGIEKQRRSEIHADEDKIGSGCSYQHRCPDANEACREKPPPERGEGSHRFWCHQITSNAKK